MLGYFNKKPQTAERGDKDQREREEKAGKRKVKASSHWTLTHPASCTYTQFTICVCIVLDALNPAGQNSPGRTPAWRPRYQKAAVVLWLHHTSKQPQQTLFSWKTHPSALGGPPVRYVHCQNTRVRETIGEKAHNLSPPDLIMGEKAPLVQPANTGGLTSKEAGIPSTRAGHVPGKHTLCVLSKTDKTAVQS